MITDWITVNHLTVADADLLYPTGLDWTLNPGINAIIGGTGLGKTTLVYALQYAIFDKMVANATERIERDFFRERMTDRPPERISTPPSIKVQFSAENSSFTVKRNLLTGALEPSCNRVQLKTAKYFSLLPQTLGTDTMQSLVRLQSHLLFFGEGRHFLAWDNLLQNEILHLLFSDLETYKRLNVLWAQAESYDSEARNISAQASRLDKDLERFAGASNVQELERRSKLSELRSSRESYEAQLEKLRTKIAEEETLLQQQEEIVAQTHSAFHRNISQLEDELSSDLDQQLLTAAAKLSPTITSMRHALESFFKKPAEQLCPCCGRPGATEKILKLAAEITASTSSGHCIVCNKPTKQELHRIASSSDAQKASEADLSADALRGVIVKREQTKSRLDYYRKEEATALDLLDRARAAEIEYLNNNPVNTVDPLRVAAEQLRSRQHRSERQRAKVLDELKTELAKSNEAFERIQSAITQAFKKYATLYLDEPCDVVFLKEDELPGKRGPQIKAPHAAFFPVVSGQTRPSPHDLSDAQRSFIDLAFRMAVVDVWHQKTGKTMTMIVETPEGAVDIAYMKRVATMLRTFGNQGHTVIITTNLNNDIFLPEVLAAHPQNERRNRVLNLLELGRPRKVQKEHWEQFRDIVQKVEKHPLEA